MLLGSPPDMVHSFTLRKTGSSTPSACGRRYITKPGVGIHPCCSGLQVQGTAISPTSAALPRRAVQSESIITHSIKDFNSKFSIGENI